MNESVTIRTIFNVLRRNLQIFMYKDLAQCPKPCQTRMECGRLNFHFYGRKFQAQISLLFLHEVFDLHTANVIWCECVDIDARVKLPSEK